MGAARQCDNSHTAARQRRRFMMRWWQELQFIFERLIRRHEAAADLDEEIRIHLAHEIDENVAAGMSPQEAHYAAQHAFGSIALSKERSREMWGLRSLEILY